MTDLAQRLSHAAARVFDQLGFDASEAVVRRSDRPDLADFQCNGALAIARRAGRRPLEVAEAVAAAWTATELCERPAVAGPGFLNFRVADSAVVARLQDIAHDERAGAEGVRHTRRVLVDYGGLNVAKPMHVGHLRSCLIGESLKRIFRFRGDEVRGDAHFGDWGFQMGLLIVALDEELGGLDDAAKLDEALRRLTLEDLDRMYPAAAARAKSDDAYRDRARKATLALQSGEPRHRRIWSRMREVSMKVLQRELGTLGVYFELWNGESDADQYVAPMLERLRAEGLVESDQGAQIVRVGRAGDRREVPPLIVVSSEGSAMYGTTDLATIVAREREFDPDLYLYVVDQRQADHFVQVFRVAEAAGWVEPGKLEHIGFGTMNGPDGKPFKTRAGGVLKLGELIDMVRSKARQRLREAQLGADLAEQEFEQVAQAVAVAALKLADLVNFRGTSYVFDLERFTSFEGKTGPYLLYAVVRIRSILRKAEALGVVPGPIGLGQAEERQLALVLDAFGCAVSGAYEKRAPHVVAEHAFALAQRFSSFYEHCPILQAPQAGTRASRLALAEITLRQLRLSLELLGVASLERM